MEPPPVKNDLRPRTLRFGAFEVDPRTQELRKEGMRVRLPAQSIQILLMLLETPGELVSREDLRKKLWPEDTFVDFDHGVNAAVNRLRETLCDSAEKPRFIETLPRRGYRFIALLEGAGANHSATQPIPAGLHDSVTGPLRQGEPQPPATAPETAVETRRRIGKRRRVWAAAAGMIFSAAVVFGIWFVLPPPQPRILGSRQITHDGKFKCCVFTDGLRLYVPEKDNDGIFRIKYVSVAGGDPITIPTPSLYTGDGALMSDISPDHDRLLVQNPSASGCTVWSVPLTDFSPRPLANLPCGWGRWSPDGKTLVYGSGSDLFLAHGDGTEPRRLVSARGVVGFPVWSPDGRAVSFTVTDTKSNASPLFEVSAEGGEPHEVTPNWRGKSSEFPGTWTPDGRYFLFLSSPNGRSDIWAIREHERPWARSRDPIQLTSGPIDYGFIALSPDGKKIFALGVEPRGELVRYFPKTARFEPFLQGLSADCCVYSNDGQWIAYVTYPEGDLWRSRADGSQRQQLTWPPMGALNPHWSPDEKEIAFTGLLPGKAWKTFIIPAEGGKARQLTQSDCPETDANWSPDGTHMVFGTFTSYVAGTSCPVVIYTMDLRTRELSTIPGSEGLWSPRWSPNGKRLVAQTRVGDALMIYEFASQKWSELIRSSPGGGVGFQQWSQDSKLVYYRQFKSDPGVYSIRVEDHKTEKLADLSGISTTGTHYEWAAVAPDGSPLILRDVSLHEIYALDFEEP